MATFPTGVTVVTALAPDGRPWGMTCSSVCSVTLRPDVADLPAGRVQWERGYAGPHLTADAHAIADCQVVRTVEMGDHLVLFGEVFGVQHRQPRSPLLYGLRSYSAWPTDQL
ncbi:flavin reductase family protein [Actinokineospora sp.]|uniref:flavin reductase family protein n=1 Tax=Actinokineospora sp. TaxID=1872133 RepID=UPI003D6A6A32